MAGANRSTAILYTDLTGLPYPGPAPAAGRGEAPPDIRGILRSKFQEHRGQEVRTVGNAFLVEFSSAVDAVSCATDIQRTLRELSRNRAAGRWPALQIGVHVGTVLRSGWDVVGEAVDVASWVQPLAEPGGICISGEVFERVRYLLDLPVTKLATQEFRHVRVPVEVYKVDLPRAGGSPRSELSSVEMGSFDPGPTTLPSPRSYEGERTAPTLVDGAVNPRSAGAEPKEEPAPETFSEQYPPRSGRGTGRWLGRVAAAYGTVALSGAVLGLPLAEFMDRTLSYTGLLHVLRTIFPLVAVLGAAQVGLGLLLRS